MIKEYTVDEVQQKLEKYFKGLAYKVEKNPKDYFPARVPLYCKKDNEELVIDFTVDKCISKDTFFPLENIGGVRINESCPVRFYQYYFVHAKIFFAYPDYVVKNNGFNRFKKVCGDRGIGLLEISDTEITEVTKSRVLFDKICNELEINDKNKGKLEYHLNNCLQYFVYYPHPIFKRRAITGKLKERMSFVLIDKLLNLKNITYRKVLIDLSKNYRNEYRDDYEIAEYYITELWKKYLGLQYPNIHKKVESMLQQGDRIYREHFVHMFQVFLIGAYILDSIYPTAKFKEKYKYKIENAWLAASTFHDFGYGLQKFDDWLMRFFKDVLMIKSNITKENINFLNLDAAMIREALFDKIIKIVNHIFNDFENKKENIVRFFYEKVVRDRNHGVLSAISLLKLFDESSKGKTKRVENEILEAAAAIMCHDEDIWETLCGCKGFSKDFNIPSVKKVKCAENCKRRGILWPSKEVRIDQERILNRKETDENYPCESWERKIKEENLMNRITFEKYPILFLLIFCDNIQDEGRVTNYENTSKQDSPELIGIDVDVDKENEEYCISVKLDSNNSIKKKEAIARLERCLEINRFKIQL